MCYKLFVPSKMDKVTIMPAIITPIATAMMDLKIITLDLLTFEI